jgi:2-C-methyl-D-erythritol 4-phosphate cytidylyltransferase
LKLGAIIAAAGSGLRMNNSTRKQYLLLEGVPVLVRSVRLFLGHPALMRLVVVVPPADLEEAANLLQQYCPTDRLQLVGGRDTRQESVLKGLQAMPLDCDLICVHDAARPLATEALLERLIAAAQEYGAAVPVIDLSDTVKVVGEDEIIVSTPPRSNLRCVQTPQVFRAALIRQAYEEAASSGAQATDDASLVELLGEPVKTVEGESSNLKITAPPDLALAGWYLRGESI